MTAQHVSCPVCSGTLGLPHIAHRDIICARCDGSLGLASAEPEVGRKWWGLHPLCEDALRGSVMHIDAAIREHNAELQRLDAEARAQRP